MTFDAPKCCMPIKARPCRIPHVYIWLIHLVDPQLKRLYQNTCIAFKLQPLSLGPGLAHLKLRYNWDRGYIFFTELIKHCAMYSDQNYTILNVLWQSKAHVTAKYRHVKNDVIFTLPQGPYGRERVMCNYIHDKVYQKCPFIFLEPRIRCIILME